MTIGLIDEDWISRKKMTFPNLSLMKIGAYHRQQGDTVEWYEPLMGDYDMVYSSRVFSEEYTKPFSEPINAVKVIRGGVRLCDIYRGWQRGLQPRKGSSTAT